MTRRGVDRCRRFARALLLIVGGAAALAVLPGLVAAPASAHSATLPDAAYYRSAVTAIAPAVPGLDVQVTRSGETVTLANHTGKTVLVFGYQGEDYLRVTATGVDENTNSLSAALNGTLVIDGLPQQFAQTGNNRQVAWTHVADAPVFSWHDHRVHWMAQQRPAVVAADPSAPHRVFDWAIDLRVGTTPTTVKGTLTWVGRPGLTGWPLMLLEGLAVVAGLAVAVLLVREYLKHRASAKAASSTSPGHGLPGGMDDGVLPREPTRSRLLDR